jgi:hypothetical protein
MLFVAVAVLVVAGGFALRGAVASRTRGGDASPEIQFSWGYDSGEQTLRHFSGQLTMSDDWGLDFTTYRLRIPEANREIDLPIEGLVGKKYESPVYLGLLDGDASLKDKQELTLEFTIADDKGHSTTKSFVVPFQH